MGKRFKKHPHQVKQLEDPIGFSKQKKIEQKAAEKQFIEQFENRQEQEAPAVTLKESLEANGGNENEEGPGLGEVKKHNRSEERKKKWRNDGLQAVHVPISELIEQRESESAQPELSETKNQRKGKRKVRFSLEGDEVVFPQNNDSLNDSNVFDAIISESNERNGAGKKRRRIDSSSGEEEGKTGDPPTNKDNDVLDEISESDDDDNNSCLEDEGDDLEELEENDNALLRMADEEESEAGELDSFIDDESYLDADIWDMDDAELSSNAEFEPEITGFECMKKSANCVVLQADENFSTAVSSFKLHKFSDGVDHSVQIGLKALQWMLSPVDPQMFFNEIFQKRVLVVQRRTLEYFDGFFGTNDLMEMLQKNFLEYGKDINIASYTNGTRRTHNPMGEHSRVYPSDIRAHIAVTGRSVQCVQPQAYNNHIWYLCEVLQEVFCSFVGANNYLTPANSAGFAPHWDDIDAFMLQTEGRKYWKIFAPPGPMNLLPLESSENIAESELEGRSPVFEGWLEQGDTLYVPRGFIHQAKTGKSDHSHHVTVSVCRRHSFADFFERSATEFLQMLTARTKRLRSSLPPLLLDMGGVAKQEYPGVESLREKVLPVAEYAAQKFANHFSSFVPSFIDLMSKEFFKTALPPLLSQKEMELSCLGGKQLDLLVSDKEQFNVKTKVRLIRKHAQRVLFEDDHKAFLVHRMLNSRHYEGRPEAAIDFPVKLEDGFTTLVDVYPEWTEVGKLGLASNEQNIALAELLYNNCLLLRMGDDNDEREADKEEERHKEEEEKQNGQIGSGIMASEGTNEEGVKAEEKKRKKKRKHKKKKNKVEKMAEERGVEDGEE